jgi:histidine kinase
MEEKLIYESQKSKIYLVNESEWGQPVVMKILNYEFPSPLDISQFYNEYDIISGLEIPGIRRVLKRTKVKNRHGMLLEWIDSQTLAEAFKNKQDDIVDFLYIAIAIAQAISDIHRNNIIHKDINSNNILVNLQKRIVKIIDFGISSKIDLKQQHLGNPERLEGTLTYISPEQTGRMNRVVDYRSDLYSMGVSFYEMLAGQPPFVAKDAMELVHCHIAQTPKPIYQVNPKVPRPISDCIDRLLAKNAEDRYQSALGVKYDLEHCLTQYLSKRNVSAFKLAQNDFSGKFQIPQKLYGREKELDVLINAFERSAHGHREMILVAGYSGTGKSVLVREVHKPITRKLGYFIEGKFDQFQRSVPYFAIIQALKEFVNILLTENEEKLGKLRSSIQAAVGEEGKVLTDVIPNLEHVIGKQPEVAEIGGTEAQNRFNYVFRKLVTAIATQEHPIVLFIDDLQWADSASLSLLNVLMTNPEDCYLLCIGAYRDNEVSASHPFIMTVGEMQEAGARISTIQIGNLSQEHVNQLIAEAVGTEVALTHGLTELVYAKTQGNAFFVTQFLMSLYQERLLTFDYEKKQWSWDLQKVKEQNITDNVVQLMAGKIRKLDPETQKAMKLAACIGNSFDLNTLAVIHQKEPLQTQEDLYESLSEGLIVPAGDTLRFSHDRIQQAVYSLIPDAEKNAVHLSIGRLLLTNIRAEQQEERLFDIVNQWNWGIEIVTDPADRELLARLNLRAGMKAKQTSAFKPAFDYFETGIKLLKADPWNTQYELCRDLHTEATEAAYLNGDFVQMDRMFQAVLDNARDLIEKIKPYEIRILAYKAENKLLDAIKTGLELLSQLGENFPKKPTMVHDMVALVKTRLTLRGKTNDKLQSLPTMTDPYKIAAMRIMADIASSSYWATPTLFPLLIFRMVHLSLKYGNTAVSAFSYAAYGVIMCGLLGDMKNGYEFGKLGLILLEKFNAKEWKTQIYTPIYALTMNWNEHVHNTLRPLQESYHIGMETGAIEFACINTNIYCIHAYLSGKRLVRLEEETRAYSQSFNQFKQETNFNYNEVYRQPMLNFMGKSADPLKLTGEAYDEDKMMKQNTDRNDKTGTFFIHFNKLILSYYFNDYARAAEHAEASRKLLDAVLAKFEIPNHHFYETLSLLALYPKAAKPEQRKYMSRIRKNSRQMKKWSKDAPENYLHKYHLMEAERLRVLGHYSEARLMYDKAIEGASKNDYIHEEALAYELAGRCYLELKSGDLTEFYLKAAYNAYREWGAAAKLRHLEQNFPKYVSAVSRTSGSMGHNTTMGTGTSMINGAMLDISTVLKASTTISGMILLPKLLRKLMEIVIENAGAQQGMLLLEKNDQLFIEAQTLGIGEETAILQSIPVQDCGLLAETLVKYVKRTGQSVVIHNAGTDIRWENDPYIVQHKPQSILCLPIFNQGKFIGILYLENNLTTGAFTQDRIDLLSLLSGQIAVSIDNAILYEQMEQKVENRTAELATEKKKADDLLYNILPFETAEELKRNGHTQPRRFENVTVMFTDFKGFTMIAEKLNPEELVSEVDTCFGAFDEIIGKYGIEKIKTIGDAYMCVGGLPVPNSTHPEDVVKAALEIQRWVGQHKEEQKLRGLPYFDVRIGLHSGPVVAGVVGSKKFAYDIWGDTVNTASRMESSGEPGKVNISGTTYQLINHRFDCSFRGEISAKNKGNIKMYFVENIR